MKPAQSRSRKIVSPGERAHKVRDAVLVNAHLGAREFLSGQILRRPETKALAVTLRGFDFMIKTGLSHIPGLHGNLGATHSIRLPASADCDTPSFDDLRQS
jgi:hypothetical protein